MPFTSRGYPYPEGTSDPDIAGDMENLAAAVDTDVNNTISAITTYVDNRMPVTRREGFVIASPPACASGANVRCTTWTAPTGAGFYVPAAKDVTTSDIKVNAAGNFRVTGAVTWPPVASASLRNARLYKNGGTGASPAGTPLSQDPVYTSSASANPVSYIDTGVVAMALNDLFGLWLVQNTGVSVTPTSIWLFVERLT